MAKRTKAAKRDSGKAGGVDLSAVVASARAEAEPLSATPFFCGTPSDDGLFKLATFVKRCGAAQRLREGICRHMAREQAWLKSDQVIEFPAFPEVPAFETDPRMLQG